MSTSGLQEPMILSRIMPTYSLLVFPPDDILEGLYKLRIRESEKLKTVLELYDLEIHQKKVGPDYHRLKTMVKRSIEQEIRNKILKPELEIMKETLRSSFQGGNSVLEIVGNGKPTGSVLKETIVVSVTMSINVQKMSVESVSEFFMQQNERKSSRTRSPRGKSTTCRTARWLFKDYLKGTRNNSFCEKWHPPEVCSTRPRVVAGFV